MIKTKKELNFYIAADRIMANRPVKTNLKLLFRNILFPDYILMYLKSMRYVAYFKNSGKSALSLQYFYHKRKFLKLGIKLGFSIDSNAFGYGLLLPHYGTIVVGGMVNAGNFCVLHTSTCIGGKNKQIGDGLYLSAGASIFGEDLVLGNHVNVSANSMVNKSFAESNILLAGTPAVIKGNSKPWYERDGKSFEERVEKINKLWQTYFETKTQ